MKVQASKQTKMFKVPEACANNAALGLSLANKYNRAGTSLKGLKDTAKELASGECSLEVVKSIFHWLQNEQENLKPLARHQDGAPVDHTLDYLMAGGTAGLAFCRQVLKQEQILKSFNRDITEEELRKQDKIEGYDVPVVKQLQEEKRIATFVVLEPQDVSSGMTTDLHGDVYTEEDIEDACHSFAEHSYRANILHRAETEEFQFLESYVTKSAMVLGDRYIKKGTWLAVCKFSEDLWKEVKSGRYNGLSIQCLAQSTPLDNEEE